MQFVTRPLETWPRPVTEERRRSPYFSSFMQTVKLLEKELGYLGAEGEVVIQLDVVRKKDLRREGLPLVDLRTHTPRVAMYFASKHGPLTYYADAFPDWESNLRAIALGLNRLRLVEETGIISRGEQYKGFAQLGSGIPMGPAAMTVGEASHAVAKLAYPDGGHVREHAAKADPAALVSDKAMYVFLYRVAVKRCHPDAGGKAEDWQKLQDAAAVLDKHFAGGAA